MTRERAVLHAHHGAPHHYLVCVRRDEVHALGEHLSLPSMATPTFEAALTRQRLWIVSSRNDSSGFALEEFWIARPVQSGRDVLFTPDEGKAFDPSLSLDECGWFADFYRRYRMTPNAQPIRIQARWAEYLALRVVQETVWGDADREARRAFVVSQHWSRCDSSADDEALNHQLTSDSPLVPLITGVGTSVEQDSKRSIRNQRFSQKVDRGGEQRAFRNRLLHAYEGRCAVTGVSVKAVLEAAHIRKYEEYESFRVNDGLLLRVDIHKLFDAGLLVIDEINMRILIAASLAHSEYAALHGRLLLQPKRLADRPDQEALHDHRMSAGHTLMET